MEGLRRFLSRPIGWAVFQVVLLFLVLLLSRFAAELFGGQAFGIRTDAPLAIVAGIVSYLIRRRFLRSTGWGFDDEGQADDRRPPGLATRTDASACCQMGL